ncbi:MAG: hypothetical protein ACFB0B_18865 [Thermonemataceae bacterium]
MSLVSDFHIDVLCHIDFFTLHHEKEEGLEKFIETSQKTLGFDRYYQRGARWYVTLTEVAAHLEVYTSCVQKLKAYVKDKELCCEIEQAIGIFEKTQLIAFLSADEGPCYDSYENFKAVEEIFIKGASSRTDDNTFYGEIKDDHLLLHYTPEGYEIAIEQTDLNKQYRFEKTAFSNQLITAKEKAKQISQTMREKLAPYLAEEGVENVFPLGIRQEA